MGFDFHILKRPRRFLRSPDRSKGQRNDQNVAFRFCKIGSLAALIPESVFRFRGGRSEGRQNASEVHSIPVANCNSCKNQRRQAHSGRTIDKLTEAAIPVPEALEVALVVGALVIATPILRLVSRFLMDCRHSYRQN